MRQRQASAVAASTTLVTAALLLAGCAATRDPVGDDASSGWSRFGLDALDEQHVVTVIAPGRKCWSLSIEGMKQQLGACGGYRYTIVDEDFGTARAVKQSGGPWALTLVVEFEGQEKGRATTTEQRGTASVKG